MMKAAFLSLFAGMLILSGCQRTETGVEQPADTQRYVIEDQEQQAAEQEGTSQVRQLPAHLSRDVDRIEAEISATRRQLDQEISDLRNQMQQAEADQQQEYQNHLANLEQERNRLMQIQQEVDQLSQTNWESTRDEWDNLRADVHSTLDDWFEVRERTMTQTQQEQQATRSQTGTQTGTQQQ